MKTNRILLLILGIAYMLVSCKKFIDIGAPQTSLVQQKVFENDDQAISAVTGIYATMAGSSSYASGSSASITCLAGASSDELVGYSLDNIPFYENQITADNSSLAVLYSGPYNNIYAANAILEGLAVTNGITEPVKRQLKGEAFFIRAFAYFYLVNLFGEVPLQLTTDYRITQIAKKSPVGNVYGQIISDLKEAESLLTYSYPSAGRVRPNKSVVESMLARVYLYLKDWDNAEKYSSLVIAKTDVYNLVAYDNVFLSTSQEAIWQLFPTANSNAQEGALFILTTTPTFVSMKSSFALNAFEPNDKRQAVWVRSIVIGTANTYYYPYKYKIRTSTNPTEYSTVLRLAEQYLIRAEARINQEKIDLGVGDLNIVRQRRLPGGVNANTLLPVSISLTKENAILAVEQERKVELFSEWGHRWFDLKRTGKVYGILGALKPTWKNTDELYPIPINELNRNRSITQNDGY